MLFASTKSDLYAADGNRVKKTVGRTNFYYPFAHYEIGGTTTIKHYAFNGQRVAMRSGSTLTYLHSDHLGSTVLETNASGIVTTDEKYSAYGKQRDSGKVVTDNRFTGQKEDGSGLMYYSARFYDPQTGMFVSPDTIVPDAGNVFAYDRYMYVYGRVMNANDPSGHSTEKQIYAGDGAGSLNWYGQQYEAFTCTQGFCTPGVGVSEVDEPMYLRVMSSQYENIGMMMALLGSGEVLPEGVSPGEALPVYKGGKAQGILDTGNELIPLESGYKGPSARMPEDAPGMRTDMPNRSHVEAHAATIMREQGLNEATLYINKEPCTPLMGCNENLKHMLPEDATLHVKIKQSDGGWVSRDYTGVSDSVWEQVWSTISTLWKR